MRTALSPLQLIRPRSLDEALSALSQDGSAQPLAGGTDVYVELNFGTSNAQRFIDVCYLDALRAITIRGDTLSIGAAAPYTSLINSPVVRERLPMLVAAAREIGGVQIQNRGTLGGNLGNASPAGDSLPVLLAADAIVVLRSTGGERRVAVTEFFTGYRRTARAPNELIVAVEIPPVRGKQWFFKVGTRAAQAISKLVMAAVRDNRPRIALGSVAAVPVRLPRTEAALAGGATIAEARRVLESEITPIDDVRSTAAYRLHVAGNLLEKFWRDTT